MKKVKDDFEIQSHPIHPSIPSVNSAFGLAVRFEHWTPKGDCGLSKNYVVLGVGRWVKVKTLRLHYVRGEGGGIGRKHYEKYYVFSLFWETKRKTSQNTT